MERLLNKFSFDGSKIDWKIWALLGVIWLVTVACGLGSVLAQRKRFTPKEVRFWILMIVAVPMLGLLAYLPYAMPRDGFTVFGQPKPKKKTSTIVR